MSSETSKKYLKIALAVVVFGHFAWPVLSQATLAEAESSTQIIKSNEIVSPTTNKPNRPFIDWVGGLFGPTRAVPIQFCNCSKFLICLNHFSLLSQ